MSNDHIHHVTQSVSASLKQLRSDVPDTMRAFSQLAQAAGRKGALDRKTKGLIVMALSVAARGDPCLGYPAQALVKLGATRAEFEDMLGMCIYMGGGPALMCAGKALQAYEEFGGKTAAATAAGA